MICYAALTGVRLLNYFESINHELILAQKHNIDIEDDVVALMSAYIYRKQQCVSVGNMVPNFQNVVSGMHQCSILGPFNDNIYVASLCECKKCWKRYIYSYDKQVYHALNATEAEESVTIINNDLRNLIELLSKHTLQINAAKCSVLSGIWVPPLATGW